MKAIIFGANGQDSYFLKSLLGKNGVQVISVARKSCQIIGDVSDYNFVHSLIENYLPDFIFHFAATSSTSHNFLFENNNSISNGTINILESVRLVSPRSKVFLSGSAMQFKNSGLPIDENTIFDASSHYAVARIHSVYTGRYYREVFGLKVYVGYLFNHDSEFRSDRHVNRKIIDDLKKIKDGALDKLILGNPDVRKEFNFAGDIVEAVWILINQEEIYEAVIGSGVSYSLRDWVKINCELLEIDFETLVIEINRKFKCEYDILVSNPVKIKSIGWEPNNSIYDLAQRIINYKEDV